MSIKSIFFMLVCFLLSGLAMPAIACSLPPDCGDCCHWVSTGEEPNGGYCELNFGLSCGDCSGCNPCNSCIACFCIWDCDTCYKCSSGSCVPCKCWDDGDAITGSITAQDALLCEVVIHTSSISDTDHWTLGGNGEDEPTDTISSYSWDQAAGTNPETGTFTGATDQNTVEWQAPPCKGTVIIRLDADDAPDSMDNPCPDSERDDPNKVFEGTSTVYTGCSDCGAPGDVTPNITEDANCVFCDSETWGYGAPIGPHTYTLKIPCYDSCKWYAYLDKVDSTFNICRSCPDNPPTVACLDDVAQMNQTEACDHLQNFPNNPVQLTDIDEENSCQDCVTVHEETHMDKDWKEDSLQPEVVSFACWCADQEIDIDCGDSDSTDCTTALTAAVKAAYDEEWNDRIVAALNTYQALKVAGEISANAAYLACYQDIYDALDAKCNP